MRTFLRPQVQPLVTVYVLFHATNNYYAFNLESSYGTISVHRSEETAIAAGKLWIQRKFDEQKEGEDEWHTGDERLVDGSWKSMINWKKGGRDLVVQVKGVRVVD